MIKVLLIDDHSTVAEGTKALVEQEQDMKVTVETNPLQVLNVLTFHKFDLILLDLYMPHLNGLELTKKILAMLPESRIIIYSGFDIAPHFNMLIESGVSGFVSKTSSREQLVNALRSALRDEVLLPISLVRQLRRVGVMVDGTEQDQERIEFNEKENKILVCLSKGLSSKEMTKILLMSQRTVEYNITSIFKKLNVKSRNEAVSKAKEIGLIAVEDL